MSYPSALDARSTNARPLTAGCNRLGAVAISLGVVVISGCATLSPDGGFGDVQRVVKERSNQDARWPRNLAESEAVQASVRETLARPLSVDDAVHIALVNNRGLQATYAELGVADAELVAASWPRNPGFSFSHLQGGGDKEIERGLTLELVRLLTIPLAVRVERGRLEMTQLSIAVEVLDVVGQTRRAYFSAVAAQQAVSYMEQVQVAAEAGAELARRMSKAGNWSKLDQAREQLFYAAATAQVVRARQAAVAQRERLTRLLGLSGSDIRFELPERLPDLPDRVADGRDIEVRALSDRLDIQALKKDLEGLATSLGLTKASRFVNVLELGPKSKSETGRARKDGYEISVEIPLFDWTESKVAKAEYIYMQRVSHAAELAVNAQSEVRESFAAYRTNYELARHYRDEVVPLRKRISDENQLRYNGMLISVFGLLADAREQVMSVNASIDALRDFWLAETDLQSAMMGTTAALSKAARSSSSK
jgi:outer membrane protein TolC